MGVERFELVLVAQACEDAVRLLERALDLCQALDEARATLEEVGELVDRQLPR